MFNVKKTFYSIGQGCFYSEQIYIGENKLTIVYDCGSEERKSKNKGRLEKVVSLSHLDTIDYLVISHFHEDHINGIEILKDFFNIRNVIIPKLNPLDIIYYLKTRNTIKELLLNPTTFFRGCNTNGEDPRIITIHPKKDKEKFYDSDYIPEFISHYSNIPIFKNERYEMKWILRFYIDKGVFKNNLTQDQSDLINSIHSINDYENNLPELKKIYRTLSRGKVNLTSMSMLSAPIYEYNHFYNSYPISVMNGDILLDSEDKIAKYTQHFSEFSCFPIDFHIPHHGCHKNLIRPIDEWEIRKGIIMSGYDNQYGHPSGIILRKFYDSKIPVLELTELDKNCYRIYRF